MFLTAKEFCTWCKSAPGTKSEEGRRAHSLLTRLYADALDLDELVKDDPDIESKEAHARASAGPFQYYSSQFDPSEVPPEEHDSGDLADDVADIYSDLSARLALVDSGHMAAAQWEIRISFLTHLGRPASGAIRALYCWYVDAFVASIHVWHVRIRRRGYRS